MISETGTSTGPLPPRLSEELLQAENRVLKLVASGAALAASLDALTRLMEAQFPEMLCSVLLLDKDGLRLRHGAAPSLPEIYTRAIDGAAIGPNVGSCGSAAFLREPVFVEDIATDPLWNDYRALALPHDLHACWSTPIFDSEGRVLGTFAIYYRTPGLPTPAHLRLIETATDIAAIAIGKARSEEALRLSNERYEVAARAANDALWDRDLINGTVYYAPRLAELLRYPHGSGPRVPGDLRALLHPDDREAMITAADACIAGKTPKFESEPRLLCGDGKYRWFHMRGLVVTDASGTPARFAGSISDVNDRRTAEARLHHDAFHDSLTGLPNRALFYDRLESTIRRSRREHGLLFAVIMLDLDYLKQVNDTLGHPAGDQFLIEAGQRISECIRESDTLARLGGDEFAILLESGLQKSDALKIAGRIVECIAMPMTLDSRTMNVGVSLGIAFGSGESQEAGELIRDADLALYRAKAAGRARYEVFDPQMRAQAMGAVSGAEG